MEFHEYANLFPMLPEVELQALADDIAKHGLNEPVTLLDGKVLDGRNRWKACEMAGISAETTDYTDADPLAFVLSSNLHRRHLNESQRAMVAASIANMSKGDNQYKSEVGAIAPTSQSDAAVKLNVSRDSVKRARKVKAEAIPEVVAKVEQGEMSVAFASQLAIEPEAVQEIVAAQPTPKEAIKAYREERHKRKPKPELPEGKYQVIYADPPWSYNDKQDFEGGIGAIKHYPLMSIDELCDMKVDDLAADDSVLFMWVTSPLLEECFPVIKAWGFKYKTSFVWDKVRHNMGHYNSVRHEFLLVCTRGSYTPEVKKLYDSVQSIERTGKHSEKPQEFREIIETLYPSGKKIELFARSEVANWEVFGNEL